MGYKNDMKARIQIVAMICLMAQAALGDSPPHGKERLRELAVFPSITLQSGYEYKSGWNGVWLGNEVSLPADLKEIRKQLNEKPNDIDLKLQLRFLLEHNHQTNDARICNLEVEQLCRKRLETKAEDGWVMVQLSQTLENLDKPSEAESYLRKSVVLSSNDWRGWSQLGIHLAINAKEKLLPSADRSRNYPLGREMEAITTFHASPEEMKQSEELQHEAEQCMGKAEALGKNESLFWQKRFEYSGCVAQCNLFRKHQRGEPAKNPSTECVGALSKSFVDDLRRAASLRPDDAKLIGLAEYAVCTAAIAEAYQNGKTSADGTGILTDAVRKSVREAASRLENLYPKLDKTNEAAALEYHGMLVALVLAGGNDLSPVISDFRRAVALDPKREQAWDMLIGLSFKSASPEELEQLCESRIKANPTVRNHLILAKYLVTEKKWNRANEEAKSALKLEPENLDAGIMLAALSIRSEPIDRLPENLPMFLFKINERAQKLPEGNERNALTRASSLNWAIVEVLLDRLDGKNNAKGMVEDLLRNNPDDQDAKNIRAALE